MAILRPYKVNSYRRICDICGRPRQIEDIRFADNVAICSIHPQFRTAQQLNRINARVRPIRILPVPQPKPFAPVDTYTAEESEIFKFVTATTPFDTVNVTTNAGAIVGGRSFEATSWALIYLTGVLLEDKRPAAWLTKARSVAITIADRMIACQVTSTAHLQLTGGFRRSTFDSSGSDLYFSADGGVGCAGLCRLYTLTGLPRFLKAAQKAADFVSGWQYGPDLQQIFGPPYNLFDADAGTWDTALYPGSLVCNWGLSLLKEIAGDINVGPTTTGGIFARIPSRPISTVMAENRAFWTDGIGGINGFTAATPYARYEPGIPAWGGASAIVANDWATALFSLAEVEGLTDQVLTNWNYLMTYTSNPSLVGTYDPTLAPAQTLDATTGTNADAYYDWGSAGLMARVQSSRARAALKTTKDTLAVPRQRYSVTNSPRAGETLYLGPIGLSTLAFAPDSGTPGVRYRSVLRASKVGLMYRQQPQGFTGRGH